MSTAEITIAPLPTTEEVALTLLQWLFATIGVPTDYNIGSIVRTYSEAIGSVAEIEGISAQAEAIQAMVFAAYSVFGISPLPSTNAQGAVTFSTLSSAPLPPGQSVLIPQNTSVQTQSGVQFVTTSQAILVSGTTSVTTLIQALVGGSLSNVSPNAINQIVTGLSYPLAVTNNVQTSGGSNAETGSETLARFLAYVYSLGLCSPIAIASACIGVAYQSEEVLYATCYDDQTEILTEEGWVFFTDLINKPFTKAATLNPETHELEYQEIQQYHKYWYDGELVTINTDFLDLAVTPDHKMYVRPSGNKDKPTPEYRFVDAKDLKHTQYIKRDCIWNGQEVEYHEFGDYKIPMDLWLEFLGYYISEGCTGKYEQIAKNNTYHKIGSKNRKEGWYHRTASIKRKAGSISFDFSTQIKQTKEENKSKIRECLAKLPFNFGEYVDVFTVKNKALYEELISLGKSQEKYIPKYIKSLSSRQLLILLKALTLGDGMVRDPHRVEWKYFTSSKKLADDVQELILKCGMASSIKIDDKRGNPVIIKDRGITGYTKYIQYIVCIHRFHLETKLIQSLGRINYCGNVYCVTVPNHIIYVRRHGKTAWSGNCYEGWIAQVTAGNTSPTAGFQVYIDNGTGNASVNLVTAVTNYLNTGVGVNVSGAKIGNGVGYRPAGVPYSVNVVVPVTCSVVVTAFSINPALAPSLTTSITSAINAYFTGINFGDVVELSSIIAAIADVSFGQLTSLQIALLDSVSTQQNTIPGSNDLPIQGFNRVILSGAGVTVN